MKANRSERGQALIIIVLSIIAIFGFAALAVDIGRIYAERRRAQSAADAAALAGAYSAANTQSEDIPTIRAAAISAAKASAAKNGYTLKDSDIHIPPVGGHYEECKCEYIEVDIVSQVDPIFAQFVYKGAEKITTMSIARGRRNTNITNEYYAVHALSTDSDALVFDGNATLKVTKPNKSDTAADIYSNDGGVKNGGSGTVQVVGGNIQTADPFTCNPSNCSTVSPKPVVTNHALPIVDVTMPYCPDADETYKGVKYYVHLDGILGSASLQRGVHCIDGGITLNGGDTLTGDGVLLVLKSGGITINGNAVVNLKRMSEIVDKHSHSYNGMLVYVPPENTSTIMLGGTADSWLSGTIYAPKSLCEIGGNGTVNKPGKTYNMSIICGKVKFFGDATINLYYDKLENFQMQPIV